MAKRSVTRRKGHVIRGVELTQEQWALYQKKLAARSFQPHIDERKAEALALEDTLYASRPSTKVCDRFHALYHRSSRASIAIAALKELPFWGKDQKLIGLCNDIIAHCADELDAVVTELRSMHSSIEQEVAHVAQ